MMEHFGPNGSCPRISQFRRGYGRTFGVFGLRKSTGKRQESDTPSKTPMFSAVPIAKWDNVPFWTHASECHATSGQPEALATLIFS